MFNEDERNHKRWAGVPVKRYETDAYLLYNGGCREYEDIADYLPRQSAIKAVRLG